MLLPRLGLRRLGGAGVRAAPPPRGGDGVPPPPPTPLPPAAAAAAADPVASRARSLASSAAPLDCPSRSLAASSSASSLASSAPSAPAAPAVDTPRDAGPEPRPTYRPRSAPAASASAAEEAADLERRSRSFLRPGGDRDLLPPVAAQSRAYELSKSWGGLWGRRRGEDRLAGSDAEGGAEMADGLAGYLLDAKEDEIRSALGSDGDGGGGGRGRRGGVVNVVGVALEGWARSASPGSGPRAQSLMDRMEGLHDLALSDPRASDLAATVRPDTRTFNSLLDAWVSGGGGGGDGDGDGGGGGVPERCAALLERMESLAESGRNPAAAPDARTYAIALKACARRGDADAAEALLRRMKEKRAAYRGGGTCGRLPPPAPESYVHTTVLDAWAKSGRPDAARRAGELLHEMVSAYEATGDWRVLPTAVTFGTVVGIHASNPGRDGLDPDAALGVGGGGEGATVGEGRASSGAQRAEQTLNWMLGLYDRHRIESLRPSTGVFVSVMNAYAKSGEPDSAPRAEAVLQRMEESYRATGDLVVRPNHKCFVVCIDAWARSGARGAAERAERILKRMEGVYLRGTGTGPGQGGNEEEHGEGRKEDPSGRERLNNYGYNLVIDAWSKSRNVPDRASRAEAVFRRLQELYQRTKDPGLRPDTVTHTALMKAVLSDGGPESLHRALEILAEMERLADGGEDCAAAPDELTYLTVMDAHAKGGDIDAAEGLFGRMRARGFRPIAPCFNVVMHAWAKSGRDGAARRAEELLEEMEAEHESGNPRANPTTVSYTTCIDALSRSRDPDRVRRARAVFDRMVRGHLDGNRSCRPNLATINILITLVARSDLPDKPDRAMEVVRSMRGLGLRPAQITWNAVLNACALADPGSDGARRRALDVAAEAYRRLMDGRPGPDSVTYGTLLQVFRAHIPEGRERDEAAEELFRDCCRLGQVDQYTVTVLSRTASRLAVRRLLQKVGQVAVEDLPWEWSRNTGAGAGAGAKRIPKNLHYPER